MLTYLFCQCHYLCLNRLPLYQGNSRAKMARIQSRDPHLVCHWILVRIHIHISSWIRIQELKKCKLNICDTNRSMKGKHVIIEQTNTAEIWARFCYSYLLKSSHTEERLIMDDWQEPPLVGGGARPTPRTPRGVAPSGGWRRESGEVSRGGGL